MGNTLSSLTAFINEQRNRTDFWLDALHTGGSAADFARAVGMVIPNVKENTFKLPLLTSTVGIASGADCSDDFDNGNDSTITQTSVSLVKGLIQDSYCPHGENWESYFTALGMPAGQHYQSLGIWQPYLTADIQRRVAKRLDVNMWQGDQSGDSWSFSGWYEQLLAANVGTYNASTNPTGAIVQSANPTPAPTSGGSAGTDAAGVYNICEALIEAAMNTQSVSGIDFAADIMAGNAYIVMNPLNREYLRQNYQKRFGLAMPEIVPGLAGLQNDAFGAFNFPGYKIPVITQAWIPQGTILLSRKGNQVLAFDLESDQTRMDMWLADDHDTIRWKYRFKLGVAWRALNGSNLKYWGPTT